MLQRYERCIGCKACMASCPYNARFMLPAHRTYTDDHQRGRQVHLLLPPRDAGAGAGLRADLHRPLARVRRPQRSDERGLLPGQRRTPTQVLRPEQGTKPHVFYIGADRNIDRARAATSTASPDVLDEDRAAVQGRNFRTLRGQSWATTPYSTHVPWHGAYAIYFFVIGISAALFFFSALSLVHARSTSRCAHDARSMLSFVLLAVGGVLLIGDLSQPMRFLNIAQPGLSAT
ncbi:MAG: 4Fe-4S binding protein [Comamonadaceae bacterium]|nr:4Fe-4S binding protein [Comamonadaceae bacterium]